jgi:hypothetical protein
MHLIIASCHSLHVVWTCRQPGPGHANGRTNLHGPPLGCLPAARGVGGGGWRLERPAPAKAQQPGAFASHDCAGQLRPYPQGVRAASCSMLAALGMAASCLPQHQLTASWARVWGSGAAAARLNCWPAPAAAPRHFLYNNAHVPLVSSMAAFEALEASSLTLYHHCIACTACTTIAAAHCLFCATDSKPACACLLNVLVAEPDASFDRSSLALSVAFC